MPDSTIQNHHSFRTYLILIWFVLLRAFGNLTLAWGTRQLPVELSSHPVGFLTAFLNPYVVVGIALLAGSLLTRMALFSVADLTFVLPMTSVGYVLSVATGRIVLHEQVSATRWIGAIMICLAVALVGSTPQITNPIAKSASADQAVSALP